MKTPLFLSLLITAALLLPADLRGEDAPVDMNVAQKLFIRKKKGETLTPEEQVYLDRATAERAAHGKGGGGGGKGVHTAASGAEEGQPVSDPKILATLVPLDGLKTPYKGEDGGLYGGGHNEPPAAHLAAYRQEAAKIRPLDESGQPAASGKIVFLSLGMSNTTMEFSEFVRLANADPKKSAKVKVVDGAISGQTAVVWAYGEAALFPKEEQERLTKVMRETERKPHLPTTWTTVEGRLKENGVTANQVQAVWLKQAEAMPDRLGAFPDHARAFEQDTIDMIEAAKVHYPNLRVVYLSSRIYGGYATSPLSPEPYAYEEAFGLRWLIQKQIAGDPRLNYDLSRGPVKAPLVLWGPYLWANGTTPRASDGLVWTPEDLNNPKHDHTHPGESAKQKVAGLLLKFLETDATAKAWFTGSGLNLAAQ